ncbi:hypothetical protein M3205_19725 [Cytobacillus firmus]|uniref:hypothetical protein n=1 Tax=Cytobacillus firmus TaxID=1399 RepID=UPI00203A99FC|nr:hypothetical protein [Cytobacillus firmus]MCM3707900.1 hypothetical protein [Cytobacillus firmus]
MIFSIIRNVILVLVTLYLAFYFGYEVLGSLKIGIGIMLFVLFLTIFATYNLIQQKAKKMKDNIEDMKR